MKKYFIVLLTVLIVSSFAVSAQNMKKMGILVYPFEQSGNKNFSWIAAGLTDTVISDLSRIQDIYVFSETDRKKAIEEIRVGMTGLIRESDVIKAGNAMGADLIFTGNVQTEGGKVRVNARLINIETTKIENSVKLDGTVSAIFDLQDRVVLSLMSETEKVKLNDTKPVSVKEEEKLKVKEKPRPESGVYELYSKGLELHETDPRKALEFYLKAIAIDPKYLDALIKTGSIYSDLNDLENAMTYLRKSAEILEQSGGQNSPEYAETINNTGVVYRDMSDFAKALEYYNRSLDIRKKLNQANSVNYAETVSNIGIVYVDTGKYDEALKYYLDAQKILDDIKFQESSKYAILLNNIGGVYWSKNNFDNALLYYLKSQEIREKLGLQQTPGYAYLMNNIGGVYWKKGDNSKAILYYVKSQEIRDWLGLQNTDSYTTLLNNIALTYYKRLNDPCKGAEYMKKSVEIDKRNNFPKLKSDIALYEEMKKACLKPQ